MVDHKPVRTADVVAELPAVWGLAPIAESMGHTCDTGVTVGGQSPRILDRGTNSNYLISFARKWRNWQTRRIQDPVGSNPWGFKSPLSHSSCRG